MFPDLVKRKGDENTSGDTEEEDEIHGYYLEIPESNVPGSTEHLTVEHDRFTVQKQTDSDRKPSETSDNVYSTNQSVEPGG